MSHIHRKGRWRNPPCPDYAAGGPLRLYRKENDVFGKGTPESAACKTDVARGVVTDTADAISEATVARTAW
ncbi:MAG: hypothetical protein IJP72_03610 [Bacteroidales bacterium]|nr:hypothetical protein [Bacteroidales bacterium]